MTEIKTGNHAKSSVAVPVILFFLFIIAVYAFAVWTGASLHYATESYHQSLIHKYEVDLSHERAVAMAGHMMNIIRAQAVFCGGACLLSAAGAVLCVRTAIKRIRLRKRARVQD